MNYYQEITIFPLPEISVYSIWSKLYLQLHLALVEIQNLQQIQPVGVSFPQYTFDGGATSSFLGSKLRIFAPDVEILTQLDVTKRFSRLHDYIQISQIRAVPENTSRYLCFSRIQVKSNVQRLARRKAKREGITLEQALTLLEGFKENKLKEPFINLNSLSGGERFQLIIQRRDVQHAVLGSFSSYGLSTVATVPDF